MYSPEKRKSPMLHLIHRLKVIVVQVEWHLIRKQQIIIEKKLYSKLQVLIMWIQIAGDKLFFALL